MLITPKDSITLVLEQKTKDARLQPYETKIQKWLFFIAMGSFCLALTLALISKVCKNQYIAITALIIMLISFLVVMAYQIATTIPTFIKIRNIEREISNPLLTEFNKDIDLINELSQTFESHHLSYAKTTYTLMAKQLRERIAILVGALDKVGIIPIAITGYISYSNAQKEGLVMFNGIEWVLAGFIFLYLLAVRMSATAQWMEKISEIYSQAIALKLTHHSTGTR